MCRLQRGSILTLLLALCAPAASAREPLEPPDLSQYLRWGPVRVRPSFGFSNLGYDDNVLFSSGDEGATGDYRITLSPRLQGLILFGDRAFLEFDERVDYTVYRKLSEQNFLNQRGTARLTVPLRRFGVFTDVGLLRLKDRPTSELDSRPERRETSVGAGVILELGWRTYVELSREHSDWRNRDEDGTLFDGFTYSQLLDRTERRNRLRAAYGLTARTRLTLDASSESLRFDEPEVRRDARETRLLTGIGFGEGSPLLGSVRIGAAQIETRDASQPDVSGMVGDVDLRYRSVRGSFVSLAGRRELGFAVFSGNLFFEDRSAEARLVRYLAGPLGLEVALGRSRLSFPEGEDTRVDHVTRYELGVRFRLSENALGRRVEYALRWSRYIRDSSNANLGQTRSTVGVAAVVGF